MSQNLHQPLIPQENSPKVITKPASFFSLLKYSDGWDKLMMIVATIASLAAGASMPFFMIFFSKINEIFVPGQEGKAEEKGRQMAIIFFIIGGATWILYFIGIYFWSVTGKRQTVRFKKIYYRTLLQQQVAWYDSNDVNKLATEISGNMVAVEGALGEKLAFLLSSIISSIFGLFYAYFKCWELSLALTAFLPLLMLCGFLMMKAMAMKAQFSKISYEGASGIAEQAFLCIKTIKSFVAESFQKSKFVKALSISQKNVIRQLIISGLSMGFVMFIFLSLYSFGFWFGKRIMTKQDNKYQASTIMSTFFCFLIGGSSITAISPIMKSITQAKVAGGRLFYLINRKKTLIEPVSGQYITDVNQISLNDVNFQYEKVDIELMPQKPKQPGAEQQSSDKLQTQQVEKPQSSAVVLNGINAAFKKGKVTAIVGESGSGKSTIIQLIMRYYDSISGAVLVNNQSIKEIDIKSLRQRTGYVGQEPVLFSMSIAQNLRLSNSDLTDQQIRDVLKQANAWQFVEKFEQGIHTYVGNGGAQLSGGQKQRIAIARAIAKNPTLLILDEATSALDRKNQRQIQKTLNNLSSGSITTLVVAHRLSTVKNADSILVMSKGRIQQSGTHEQLIAKQGKYFQLVKSQMSAEEHKQINQKNTNEIEENFDENEQQNVKSLEKKKQQQKSEFSEAQLNAVFGKVWKQMKGTYHLVFLGCFTAFISGAVWPLYNVAFSKIFVAFIDPVKNEQKINNYCLLFLGIAVSTGISMASYQFCFAMVGQRLVYRMRVKLFSKLLKMPVHYYDNPKNTPGAISTKLSQDTFQINNLVTGVVGVICLNISTVVVSLSFAFYNSWQLTLVVLGLSPFMAVTGAINMKLMKSMHEKSQKFQKQAGSMISDSVCNIRTVKSFGNDAAFLNIFNKKIDNLNTLAVKGAVKTSILQGLSRGSAMFVQGFTFWIAAIFYAKFYVTDPQAVFIAIFSIIFAAMGVGQNSQFLPDMAKAKTAGASIYSILDSEDEQEKSQQQYDYSLQNAEINGQIQFRNVNFKYPQRDAVVLKNFNLVINKGEKIAFVGPSGSGKSTIFQILMRFYPIVSGQILIDGHLIEKYPLYNLRKQMGLVSQEPNLLTGSIKDNILYGMDKNNENIKEMQKYSEIAHIDYFVNQLDEKYDKEVGQKGTQVSGGQKQRIAIARCLIRKPKVFMMDESTSALDADTQKTVFKNLQPVFKNVTSISIAHRLSTIQDSDRIIVMRDGEIIEQGNYTELIALKQNFYRLSKGTN